MKHILLGGVLTAALLPATVLAEDAAKPASNAAARGSITANLLQDSGNFLTLYPYESNYVLYTLANHVNKNAIESYDWAQDARRDELKFQFSLAFPLWRGIAGDNSVLAASYTQRPGGR